MKNYLTLVTRSEMNSINQLPCRFQYNVIIHFEHPCQLVGNFVKMNFYLLFVGSYEHGIEINFINTPVRKFQQRTN